MEYDKLINGLAEYATAHGGKVLGGFDENGNAYDYTVVRLDGQEYCVQVTKLED